MDVAELFSPGRTDGNGDGAVTGAFAGGGGGGVVGRRGQAAGPAVCGQGDRVGTEVDALLRAGLIVAPRLHQRRYAAIQRCLHGGIYLVVEDGLAADRQRLVDGRLTGLARRRGVDAPVGEDAGAAVVVVGLGGAEHRGLAPGQLDDGDGVVIFA